MTKIVPSRERPAGAWSRATAACLFLAFLSGCATPFSAWDSAAPPERVTPERFTYVAVALVPQDAQKNCGAAALASVMRYWDVPVTIAAIERDHPPVDALGYSIGELLAIARANGLHAFAFPMTDEFVKLQIRHGRPLIVPILKPTLWAGLAGLPLAGDAYIALSGGKGLAVSHYVTLVGYDDDSYYLVDPADGYRKIAQADLARMRAGFGNAGILVARREQKDR